MHAALCTATNLPLAWTTDTAKEAETTFALGLIDAAREREASDPPCRDLGRRVRQRSDPRRLHGRWHLSGDTAARDSAVKDGKQVALLQARDVDLRGRRLQAPRYEVALPDRRVQAASTCVKPDPLIPRELERSRKLYRSRGAVEREFARHKNEWAMLPLRLRRLERVRLHVDLTILAQLAPPPRFRAGFAARR